MRHNPQISENDGLLGFGDLSGWYDFDSMTTSLPQGKFPRKTVQRLNSHMLNGHETNHWFQQISTTFGNYTSMQRFFMLAVGRDVWRKLKDDMKHDLRNGIIKGPLSDAMVTGTISPSAFHYFLRAQNGLNLRITINVSSD